MTVALPTAAQWARWGVPAEWSRLVDVPERGGPPRRWHVLDTGPPEHDEGAPTVLCVHGNPTWSFVWSRVARALAPRHRVVAVDQLGMGYSERTPRRRYADRVADLADVVEALDLTADGPIVVIGHDWGGAIAMGWAVAHADDLAALVLCNTGIAVPDGRSAPGIIRLAASPFLLDAVCRGTPIFVRGAARLSRGRLTKVEREALDAPYRGAPQRAAIADFVDDIPLRDDAPSADVLDAVADGLADISAPVLLAWGPDDPVFNDDFLDDLAKRMSHADRHRFPRGGHLLPLEDIGATSAAAVIADWLDHLDLGAGAAATHHVRNDSMPNVDDHRPLWAPIDEVTADPTRRANRAVVDMASGDSVTWAELSERIERGARTLRASGMAIGDRVAMLTPPGVDALVVAYAIVRAGGVAVVADRGLGLSGLRTAIRSSRPRFVVGPRQARSAARVLRWAPGATMLDPGELRDGPEAGELPVPDPDDLAAVLFTSGATGPAKGVRYTHAQLAAQRDALETTYAITADDRLVAAFAPFALYGPGLGITTALPDSDVTRPGTLSAGALSAACAEIDATMAFASPAALANVVRTAGEADATVDGLRGLRVVMSAGAPVPSELLHDVAQLSPHATLHTPYGMTESLPVADVELTGIDAADADDPHGGVCVGAPVTGAEVLIVPFGFDARHPVAGLASGLMGEILVRSPWTSAGYDGLWATQTAARPVDTDGRRWHRTGDVGHRDASGRLWVEGRSVHVISAASGPITPVPVERAVERRLRGTRVAAVGIGPIERQQLAVVIEQRGANGLASTDIAHVVRSAVEPLGIEVAAVLAVAEIPVDIRHEAKIDRAAVARWAEGVLAGRRVRPLRRH